MNVKCTVRGRGGALLSAGVVALTLLLAGCTGLTPADAPGYQEPPVEDRVTEERTVAISLAGSGSGRVSSDPNGIDCGSVCSARFQAEERVTLVAAADSGSRFDRWEAPECAEEPSCVLTLNEDTTLKAVFVKEESSTGGWTSPFTLVVIPDTQNMIMDSANKMVAAMSQWIVAEKDRLDIRFVSHVGDVVDRGSKTSHWERAHAQLGPLDGAVPYGVALGDHDYAVEEDMGSSTEKYLYWFGPERYRDHDWYRGSGPAGLSHYQVFQTPAGEFMHVALQWEAPGPATDPTTPLGWAREVISAHPELPTIITTHAYLWDQPGEEGRTWKQEHLEGSVTHSDGSVSFPGTTGQGIFEALVEPHPHVFMVLSGHYHKAAGTDEGEYHQTSRNRAGLEVYEMLSNYQEYPNGGDGWLRLIEFVPGGGENGSDRIAVTTYSPVLDEYQVDPRSRFHFDLSFVDRFPRD